MNLMGIVAVVLLLVLLAWMGLGTWANEQEQRRVNDICDRIEREPAYIETVTERLRRESRRGL